MIQPMGVFAEYIRSEAKKIGKSINETCRYWCDDEIYESIKHESEEYEHVLRERYVNQCHEPEVYIKPHPNSEYIEVQVVCKSCLIRAPNDCKRCFPLISQRLKEIIIKSMNME